MTSSIVIPPSPNWYSSGAIECHRNCGAVAFAASRNLVFVWPTKEKETGYPRTCIISDAHRNKITSVSWCQSSDDPLLVSSCAEDGRICIWNAETQALVLEHEVQQNLKMNSVTWSASEKKQVASSSEDGTIILLELMLSFESCAMRKLDLGCKLHPTLLSFSPHISWMLAVGCKGGLLYIVDIRQNRGPLHKLRSHEDDMHSISWCPMQGSIANEKDLLLATSGRDKMIKLWSTSEGKCLAQTKLPGNTGIHRPRQGQDHDKRSTWVALHFLDDKQILSSGLSGELILWDVTLKKWSIVHKQHVRGLFNISSFHGRDGVEMIWTSAQDRNLVLWSLEPNRQVPKEVLGVCEMEVPWLMLPTFGGFVYSLSLSSIDSSHMALGLGDCTIRLWNMAASKPDMTMLWNGIKGKVTALSWHPSLEGRLAFGTDEGRVGIFDTISLTKPPILSRTYHRGTVYNMCWAPSPKAPNEDNKMALYSCGGDHILIHDPSSPEAEAVNFNKLVASGAHKFPPRTEFNWKSDASLLAVGNDDGSVEIYAIRNGKFSCLGVIVAHKKLIQSLKWHPQYTFQSAQESQFHHWLAVASNDTYVKVYSVSCSEEGSLSSSLVATLPGHKERVVSVAWSPHQEGILLTASYDGTAQVWNVIDQKPLANFSGHSGRVLSCDWNALETDTAVTGGDDFSVRVWNINQQVHKTASESLASRPTREEKKKSASSSVASGSSSRPTNPLGAGVVKKKASKLKSLFPISSNLEARGRTQGLDDCKILANLKGVRLEHSASDGDAVGLAGVTAGEMGCGQYANLGFFGSAESADRMLESEIDHHVSGSNLDLAAQLQLWRGNTQGIENVLREAVKKQQLTDWLVSLAPRVSLHFWEEMCHCYGRQLAADGDIRKAVSYLMSAGHSAESIETFALNNMHREAVALSRCVYPDEGDVRVEESLSLWAAKAALDSNLELAAKCHVSTGRMAEAARVLARRADVESLKLAADLAQFSQLDQLATAYLAEAAEKLKAAILAQLIPQPDDGGEQVDVPPHNGEE